MPPYYIYNYVDPNLLSQEEQKRWFSCPHKNGVGINTQFFLKDKYKAIGIASDGIRYILDSYYKNNFVEFIKNREEIKIKRLINAHHFDFKDDISIII
jgi:hypothetical protein